MVMPVLRLDNSLPSQSPMTEYAWIKVSAVRSLVVDEADQTRGFQERVDTRSALAVRFGHQACGS